MFASLAPRNALLTPGMIALTYAAMAGILVVTVAYATVGLLLALRPGGGRMGAILLVGSAVFAAVPFGYAFAGTMAIRNPLDPVANVLVLLGPALVPIGYALILPVVALTFPDGRLPSSRWRWPARLALGALAAATILIVFTPGKIQNIVPWNPIGIDALPVWVWSLAWPLQALAAVLISVLGVAGVVTRYRRSAGVERQQLRWFVAAVALAVVPITISPLGGGPGAFLLAVSGLLLVPASVWIAVTRYRLYEIDRLISRTIGWALVTGVLGAVFVVTVVGLQAILDRVMQGETLAVAASTLVAFRPVPARPAPCPDRRRPPVRPRAVRRRADRCVLRRAPPRSGRSRSARSRHRRDRRFCTSAEIVRPLDPTGVGDDKVKAAAKALVGVQFALGCAVAAFAASGLLISGRPAALSLLILIAAYVPYAGVGSVLVTRRPRNLIGWVLLGIGWTFAVSFLPIDATVQELQTLTAPPLQEAIVWITKMSVSLTFALIATLAFLFPTGSLPDGRWRRFALVVLALIWGIVILSALRPVLSIEPVVGAGVFEVPNPIGLLPPEVFDVWLLEVMAANVLPFILVASIVAIAGRYAGARALERLQLRWLAASFGFIGVAVLAGFPIIALFDQPA